MANRTIVFTSRMKEGAEQQLLQELKNHFPSDSLHKIDGLEKLTICQGSGIFAAVFEYDGDFEKIFSEYLSDPSVQTFHNKLAAYLQDIPTSDRPADLPIAGEVLYWDGKKVQEAVG